MKNRVIPRITVPNALETMKYYENLFPGAKMSMHMPLTPEMAAGINMELTADELAKTTIHAAMDFYGEAIFFVDQFDMSGVMEVNDPVEGGFRGSIVLTFDSEIAGESEIADKLVASLQNNSEIKTTMEYSEQFWGDFYGSYIDKFGVNWEINLYCKDSPNKP